MYVFPLMEIEQWNSGNKMYVCKPSITKLYHKHKYCIYVYTYIIIYMFIISPLNG